MKEAIPSIGRSAVHTVILATAVLIASGWVIARADQPHSTTASSAAGADTAEMSTFYTGDGQIGTFPGTLVCLRCDLAHAPEAAEQCKDLGHRHALAMEDGSMVHPLLVVNEELLERINSNELHGKKVGVSGKYYPATGLILVSGVAPAG